MIFWSGLMTSKFDNMDKDDPKGAYNKALIFKGGNYDYWKDNMYVHLMLVEKVIWLAITDEVFLPKTKVDGDFIVKFPKDWYDEETKKASYVLKVRNILIYALS